MRKNRRLNRTSETEIDLRDELASTKMALEQSLDLNDEFYDVLKKWGIQEPVLTRYEELRGERLSNSWSPVTPTEISNTPGG